METDRTVDFLLEDGVPIIHTDAILERLPKADALLTEMDSANVFERSGEGQRIASCAVVGNSGALLGAKLGSSIDKADAVIRMNWAPTFGSFTPDTGSRTDLMVVGESASLYSRHEPFSSFSNFSSSPADPLAVISTVRSYDGWRQMADNFADEDVDADSLHQYIFSDYWLRLSDRAVCSLLDDVKYDCRASTGMRAFLIAAVMCDEVHVYGFGTSAYSGSGTYFQPERHIFRESTLYDYAVERAVIDFLASGEPSPYLSGWNVTSNIVVHKENTIARKDLKERWTRYPRLTVFNEQVSEHSLSALSEHKEPPIELDLGDQIRHVVASTHANVNVGKPLAAIDYRHYKVNYSNNTYPKGAQLGSGTYGSVYLAKDKVNGQQVVLKYLRSIKSKPWLAAREIMLMTDLAGKNHTMPLLDVTRSPKSGSSVLVLPFVSIVPYRKMYVYFQDIHVRYYAFALFDALAYAHSKGIIHNDVKPLNLLIDKASHQLFLADWGLGEYYMPHNQSLSFHVGTRNWKAPELLWGTHDYNYAVDVWAAGVTFAGWLFHNPHIFDANNNQEMIVAIARVVGSDAMNAYVNDYNIPVLPDWREKHMRTYQKKSWQSFHTTASRHLASPESYDLLDGIFTVDPAKRMTAAEVCAHPYFDEVRHMRSPPAWDFEDKHRR